MDRVNSSRVGRRVASAAAMVALALPATAANASERVEDGGFDAATCTASDCTSPDWSETTNVPFGPICRQGVGSCGFFEGAGSVGYSSPLNWAQFGGYEAHQSKIHFSVEQVVEIPAAPATLRFVLQIENSLSSTGLFEVKIDGNPVFGATGDTPGYAAYAPVSIDVSAFAGGARTLRFEAVDTQSAVVSTDSFNVDEVALDAPDTSPTPPPTPPPVCRGKPATVVGTNASEVLSGTSGTDVIAAAGGDDVVKAGGGNDLVCGGDGKDELRGQGGKDKLFGEDGKDKLTGGGKRDLCNGGEGRDRTTSSCERNRDV
jgi:hypothetical protein